MWPVTNKISFRLPRHRSGLDASVGPGHGVPGVVAPGARRRAQERLARRGQVGQTFDGPRDLALVIAAAAVVLLALLVAAW